MKKKMMSDLECSYSKKKVKNHLKKDIKESKKSMQEDRTLGRALSFSDGLLKRFPMLKKKNGRSR